MTGTFVTSVIVIIFRFNSLSIDPRLYAVMLRTYLLICSKPFCLDLQYLNNLDIVYNYIRNKYVNISTFGHLHDFTASVQYREWNFSLWLTSELMQIPAAANNGTRGRLHHILQRPLPLPSQPPLGSSYSSCPLAPSVELEMTRNNSNCVCDQWTVSIVVILCAETIYD